MATIFVLDNQDTLTYNGVEILRQQGHQVAVYRQTASLSTLKMCIEREKPAVIMLTGEGDTVTQTSTVMTLIRHYHRTIPMIGIGLGYLALARFYGAQVGDKLDITHGHSVASTHDQQQMFKCLTPLLSVGIYHRTLITQLPTHLIANVWYQEHILGFRHDSVRCCGFHFHPESILTTDGTQLLVQTVEWCLCPIE